MWDFFLWPDFFPPDFTSQSSTFFARPGYDIGYRRFNAHLFKPIHAKSAVIPTLGGIEGFLIGAPFLQEYFDANTHKIDAARRGEKRWHENQVRVPTHDVSALIKGPAVADVDAMFHLHWDKLSAAASPPATAIAAPLAQPENLALQIVRTLPGGQFGGLPHGEPGILEADLGAIRESGEFISLENQDSTRDDIANALLLPVEQAPNLKPVMLIHP